MEEPTLRYEIRALLNAEKAESVLGEEFDGLFIVNCAFNLLFADKNLNKSFNSMINFILS
jgi:hypothetical protein